MAGATRKEQQRRQLQALAVEQPSFPAEIIGSGEKEPPKGRKRYRCKGCLKPLATRPFVDICQECAQAHQRRECICHIVRCEGRSGRIVCPVHGGVEISSHSVGVV